MVISLQQMNLKGMLREKRYFPASNSASVAKAAADAAALDPTNADAAAKAAATAAGQVPIGVDDDGNSYSRITGCAGTVILASFMWGLGNAVIYNAYMAPASVKDVLTGVGPFILSGSALFAPYAFNQLSSIFTPKT